MLITHFSGYVGRDANENANSLRGWQIQLCFFMNVPMSILRFSFFFVKCLLFWDSGCCTTSMHLFLSHFELGQTSLI